MTNTTRGTKTVVNLYRTFEDANSDRLDSPEVEKLAVEPSQQDPDFPYALIRYEE